MLSIFNAHAHVCLETVPDYMWVKPHIWSKYTTETETEDKIFKEIGLYHF